MSRLESIKERLELRKHSKTLCNAPSLPSVDFVDQDELDIEYLLQRLEIAHKALEKILNNGRIDWTPEEAENVIIMCGDIAEEALDQLKE